MNKPSPDVIEIEKALKTLSTPADIIELRVIHKKKRTDAGYFDAAHHEELIKAAIKGNKEGANVYVVMNPIDPQLLGRYTNRVQDFAGATATDNDVTRRRWLLIDIDPVRPKDTAATDTQLGFAKKKVIEVFKFLQDAGWPRPLCAESGNGVHLLYCIDLPNDNEARDLVKRILNALADRFDTEEVKVDRAVFNAARITKLYGTVSTKGDHAELAPWRLSRLTSIPPTLTPVTVEQLRALARPTAAQTPANTIPATGPGFDLDAFLVRLNIPYDHDRHDERDRFKLDHCPFNPDHGKGEAAIFQGDNGVLGFKCMHNSCADKGWRDVRALVDGPAQDRASPPQESTILPLLFDEINAPEISADLLPAWLGAYAADVARSTQTPPAMAVMMALAVVATCTAKRFEVAPHGVGHIEPLNLWTATAMPPASRKTSTVQALTAPLGEWETAEAVRLTPAIKAAAIKRRLIERRIEKLEKDAARAGDAASRDTLHQEITTLTDSMPPELLPPRLWTGDCTPERLQSLLVDHGERMAVLSDEGGIFEVMAGLYNDGKVNLDIFLKGHAGSAARVDRQGRTAHINAPALSFGLAIQPAILAEMATGGKKRFRGNGTLARFLYAVPRSNIGSRDVRAVYQIPEPVTAQYKAGLFKLLAIPPQLLDGREVPRRLTLTPDALACWHTFAEMVEHRQGEGGDLETISDWSGKLPGAALRIAGNFHLVEHGANPPAQIEAATVQRALALCTLLIDHARAAFAMMDADLATADAKAVLKWISAGRLARFGRGEAYRQFKGRFTGKTERLDKALQELERRSIVTPTAEPTKGRPSTIFLVNLAFWDAA